MPIKTAVENYLNERRFGRPRSIEVYENVFDQLLENLPGGIKFIDQLATQRALNAYLQFLHGQGYSNKTMSTRMGFVFSLLKANGVERSSKLVKLPKVQRIRTKAYNPIPRIAAEGTRGYIGRMPPMRGCANRRLRR